MWIKHGAQKYNIGEGHLWGKTRVEGGHTEADGKQKRKQAWALKSEHEQHIRFKTSSLLGV